jgi:hypothetical protein
MIKQADRESTCAFTSTDLMKGNAAFWAWTLATWRVQFTNFLSVMKIESIM